jgi:presenilin 1
MRAQVVAFAAYMAIVAGLAMTLLLLALYQKALPALPISIFLGVALYLLGRLLLDPFIAGMYSNLVYF